ncbi:hypothetical protein OF83DRAFT_1080726 [Amylostereum chailletii]|nr:hypothetical protein OF83DRAFT_1080726 [Amylostereum chailletii]
MSSGKRRLGTHGYTTLPDNDTAPPGPSDPHTPFESRPLLAHSSSSRTLQPHGPLDLGGGTLTLHPSPKSSDPDHEQDECAYSYAYGPPGLAVLSKNAYALACAVFASLGGLTFGYDQGVIANVLVMPDFVARWPVGAWERGLMTAVLELGCLFGALGSGILADRLSRRISIMFACVVFCAGSALQCFASSLTMLVFGRAIGGLGVGALSMLSPLYMAEISPPEVRGSLLALEQFSIVLGCVVGFWTGFFTRNRLTTDGAVSGSASWRIPLGLQIAPGLLLGFGTIFLPPSPRLLVFQSKDDAALASLAKLRLRSPDDPLVQIEMLEMRVEVALLQQTTPKGGSTLHKEAKAWARLFSRRYIDRTMIGIMVMFFQQWSGINALIYYGPMLMRSLGLNGATVNLLVAGGVNIVQFIAVLPAVLYIDQWGRKPLLRVGSAIMTAAHLLIAVLVFQFEGTWVDHAFAAWVAVACVYVFTAAYGMSIGPVGWVLPSEVFPLSMRSKGVAVSTASVWLNNFIIGLITPALMEASPSMTFGVFGGASFGAYLWATHVVPETANLSLEAVDSVFATAAGREDAVLRKQIESDIGLYDLVKRLGEEQEVE